MIARVATMLTLLSVLSSFAVVLFQPAGVTAQNRPNFVIIVVDDLDTGSVAHMPAVQRQLVRNGTTLTRFFASTPLCCPSRVSLLRGQYAHNHGVLRNTGEQAGFAAFHGSGHEQETLATVLDGAGYETALVGKYLNGYSMSGAARTYIPPGWDYWVAGIDHAAYNGFNYDLNVNGEIMHRGRTDQDYMTDVLAAHARSFLDSATSAGRPFLLYLAPYAPHSPATPAPRHRGMFRGAAAPRTPAYNERNIRDKPGWVRTTPRLSDAKIERIDHDYQRRLESLQAVDEMVDAVVDQLDASGALASTHVLFLSDNGYFMGEHRQPHGKDAPYDAASRVPLIVRGPGVLPETSTGQLALNTDIAPTVVDLAGLSVPSFMDGRSLAPVLAGNGNDWRQSVLLEGFGKETESLEGPETSTPPFIGLRTEEALYVEYETGERELYDLRQDPFQTENRAQEAPTSRLRAYSRHLKALSSCHGADCRRLEDEPPPRRADDSRAGSESREHPGPARKRPADQPEMRVDNTSANAEALLVGDEDQSTTVLRFSMSPRQANADALHLRVHVAAVEHPGPLVVTLESAVPGATVHNRERLDSTPVRDIGWVTFDVSDALGDSNQLAVRLQGRDGAVVTVSRTDSPHPPSLEVRRFDDRSEKNNARANRKHAADRRGDNRSPRAQLNP